MASLSTAVRMHILIGLACYDTPGQVATSVKERFGLVLSRQRIEAYHPERQAGARLKPQWRAVFMEARARFHAEISDIPIAHRAYRLRVLERMALQAEVMGNYALVCRLLELAAREAGEE
jgi:hypothetical protein